MSFVSFKINIFTQNSTPNYRCAVSLKIYVDITAFIRNKKKGGEMSVTVFSRVLDLTRFGIFSVDANSVFYECGIYLYS